MQLGSRARYDPLRSRSPPRARDQRRKYDEYRGYDQPFSTLAILDQLKAGLTSAKLVKL